MSTYSAKASATVEAPQHQPCTVELYYTPRRPYQITMDITLSSGQSVKWELCRDMLHHGTTERTGWHDIIIEPQSEHHTLVHLHSPDGQATVRLQAWHVKNILTHAYKTVPTGTERSHIDMDAVINTLLGRCSHE